MYYQIEKLDGYYRIGSAEAVFSYLVVGRQRALLIDTGYGLGDLKAAVDSLTSLPLLIVNRDSTVTLSHRLLFIWKYSEK